jgi:1-acyl-sn-glycerol-3-phosphate acyltransferase
LNSPEPFSVPAQYPRRDARIARAIGRRLMRLSGWHFSGNLPDVAKVIITVAPHTSNWDFIVGVMALWALDIRISFIGKHTLFKGPFGSWLRSLGGIPVDRSKAHGVVGEVVDAFNGAEQMIFALAPEGTRKLDKGFKSGFLHMAQGAKVPIVLAYFDFPRRTICFGKVFNTSGDAERDLQEVLDFYRPVRGKYIKDWQQPQLGR